MTGWPRLVDGDDLMLHCMQATKKQRKRIEGHFPGASDKTLTKMKLFGADCDHEAMTGDEVMKAGTGLLCFPSELFHSP